MKANPEAPSGAVTVYRPTGHTFAMLRCTRLLLNRYPIGYQPILTP